MAKEAKAIAIDIGSKNIKIVKGHVDKRGVVSVTDVIIEPTPEECVENGYVRKQSDLNLFLKGLIGKNELGKSRCHVVLRSSDVVAREITVPVIKGPKLIKLIKNEILTVFGNTSDFYTDYAVVETDLVDYKNIYRIMAYAAPKEMVIGAYDVLNGTDVLPNSLDVHRNVLQKIVKDKSTLINQEPIGEKTLIFVDLGASYMDIDLVMAGKHVFKRSILITEDLSMAEDFDEGYESYSSLESYNPGGGYEGYVSTDNLEDYMYGSANRTQVSPIFTKVSEEIYKMLQFASSRQNGRSVDNVYLYGGNSRINGLDQYLSSSLDVTTERIFNVSNIELNADADISDVMIAAASLIRM